MSDQQMNDVPASIEGAQGAQVPLPGAALAAQRQKKGWSVEQAASLVKLAPRQIHALESDNYAALPGLAVARGFVRSYAKVLGLDAGALVAAVPQDSPVAQRDHIVPQRTLSTPFSESPLPMMMGGRTGVSPVLLAVGAVVVVAVIGVGVARWTNAFDNVPQLAWLKASSSDAETPSAEASAVQDESAGDTPVNARVELTTPTTPAAENASKIVEPAASAPATVTAESASKPTSPANNAAAVPNAAPASALPAVAAQPVTPAAPSTPSGLNIVNSKDLLRLTFREDSWVEIRRADKTTVISRVLKAGTTESFDVSDAVMLVVGNAAGVDATLRGQPLDLKVASGSNVARLDLK